MVFLWFSYGFPKKPHIGKPPAATSFVLCIQLAQRGGATQGQGLETDGSEAILWRATGWVAEFYGWSLWFNYGLWMFMVDITWYNYSIL